jgi:hypothetical protein
MMDSMPFDAQYESEEEDAVPVRFFDEDEQQSSYSQWSHLTSQSAESMFVSTAISVQVLQVTL